MCRYIVTKLVSKLVQDLASNDGVRMASLHI